MKVFLIGCGDIARHHGRAVVRLGGSITGCFDISEKNAKIVSEGRYVLYLILSEDVKTAAGEAFTACFAG